MPKVNLSGMNVEALMDLRMRVAGSACDVLAVFASWSPHQTRQRIRINIPVWPEQWMVPYDFLRFDSLSLCL
jgi:hypothetical protein